MRIIPPQRLFAYCRRNVSLSHGQLFPPQPPPPSPLLPYVPCHTTTNEFQTTFLSSFYNTSFPKYTHATLVSSLSSIFAGLSPSRCMDAMSLARVSCHLVKLPKIKPITILLTTYP